MEKIEQFKGAYSFLSNFHPCEVVVDGIAYLSSEHAYQAAKTNDKTEKARISKLSSAAKAKAAGKKVTLRPDWNAVRVYEMKKIIESKFRQHPELRRFLLETGDAELVEGNNWSDVFWGVCKGRGENWLGRILMEVRDVLRREDEANRAGN